MKSTVPYNDISPALKALIQWPTDSKGKPLPNVVYHALHYATMIERTADDTNVTVETHPGIQIGNMDTIWDDAKGESVQLGYYKSLKPSGTDGAATPAFLTIDFTPAGRGYLHIPYKNGAGLPLFQYMELTNLNKDCVNPNHEKPGIGYLFERVKPELIAEKQIDVTAEVFRVGGIVMVMELDKMRSLAPKLNVNATLEEKQLRHALLQEVQKNPELVNNMLDDEQVKIEEEVRNAIGRKLIEYSDDHLAYVWYDNRVPFCQLPPNTVNKIDALVSYLSSGRDGKLLRDKIRTALASKKAKPMQATAAEEDFGDEEEQEDEADAPVVARKPKVVMPKKAAPKPTRGPKKAVAKPAPEPAPAGEQA